MGPMAHEAASPPPGQNVFGLMSRWLGTPVRDRRELADIAMRGVPAAAIGVLLSHGYTRRDLSWIAPPRTMKRREEAKQPLHADESDRLLRALRILALATTVFGSIDRAHSWLDKPRRQFGGRSANDLMRSEDGAHVVEQALYQLDYGFAA